jgi:hypothetical protein
MKYIIKYCRERFLLLLSVCSVHFPPFLGTFTLLSFLPASLYGCTAPNALPDSSPEIVTKISMEAISGKIGDMDIFVFRNDRMQKLDCYQKIEDPPSWNNEVVSSSGERIIAVCANSGMSASEWTSIRSLSYLENLSFSLEDESIRHPFMWGLTEVSAENSSKGKTLYIKPLLSIVELKNLRCDFSGRPYDGEVLEDVRVYLTNVNAECRLMCESGILPTRIINARRLREEDLAMMSDPSLLVQDIEGPIGAESLRAKIQLICYPNNSTREGPGTPFTRLVIEGKIKGETFYWPLNINQEEGGYGIGRNERYVYDITITRKGTKDPDIPINKEDIVTNFNIEKWNEKEDCEVIF